MSTDRSQFFKRIIQGIIVSSLILGLSQASMAAVASPNGQFGKCGPYYLWYQVGPDDLTYSGNYVDLCEITFDVSEIYNDFDFVYFTNTPTSRYAACDKNRDGISDLYFQFPQALPPVDEQEESSERALAEIARQQNPNLLRWKPEHGCVRIYLNECWGPGFHEKCGAMVSLQPKPGRRNGRVSIPVQVTKRCPPYGVECNETHTIIHEYTDCYTRSQPDFLLNKQVDKALHTTQYSMPVFSFTVTVHNIGEKKGNTVLTDTFTGGTKGGQLTLSELKIDCPAHARCTFSSVTGGEITLELLGLKVDDMVKVTYKLTGNNKEISVDEVSYFTNTATLSNGTSSQVTVGVRGFGEFPRPERPKPSNYDNRR